PTPLSSSATEKAWSSFSSASTKPSTKHSPSAFLLIKSIANRWLLTLRARHAANFGRLPSFQQVGTSILPPVCCGGRKPSLSNRTERAGFDPSGGIHLVSHWLANSAWLAASVTPRLATFRCKSEYS